MLNLLLLGLAPPRATQLGSRLAQHYHLALADFAKFPQNAPLTARTNLQQKINVTIWLTLVEARLDQEDTNPGFVLLGFPQELTQAKELQKKLRSLKKPLTRVIQVTHPTAKPPLDPHLLAYYAKKDLLLTVADHKQDNKLFEAVIASLGQKISD